MTMDPLTIMGDAWSSNMDPPRVPGASSCPAPLIEFSEASSTALLTMLEPGLGGSLLLVLLYMVLLALPLSCKAEDTEAPEVVYWVC